MMLMLILSTEQSIAWLKYVECISVHLSSMSDLSIFFFYIYSLSKGTQLLNYMSQVKFNIQLSLSHVS